MRILVTGGSGFLGGAIVRNLEAIGMCADGDDLVIADIVKPGYETEAEFVFTNIPRGLSHLGMPYDIVFHCAGLLGSASLFGQIEESAEINILGTLNVLKTNRSYGLVIQPNLLGDWLNPYMISKNAGEQYGLMYREEFGTKYVSVRPTDIYGPGQSLSQGKITPSFIQAALKGYALKVYGSGDYKVRLLYVDDAARFLVNVAVYGFVDLPTIDLGSQQASNYISVRDYARLIIELTNSDSIIEYEPMRRGQPESAIDAGVDLAETGRVSDIIGFSETSFAEGLEKTISYYRELEAL